MGNEILIVLGVLFSIGCLCAYAENREYKKILKEFMDEGASEEEAKEKISTKRNEEYRNYVEWDNKAHDEAMRRMGFLSGMGFD